MFVLFATILLLASAQAKYYTDCGSKLSTVQSVSVSDCKEDATECVLKRNSNATITIQFTPTQDIKSLATEVHGIIMDLPVPFPLPQPDACKGNNLNCPLKAGTPLTYITTLPVLKSYPKVRVGVKWELINENKEDVVCVIIPAKIH